MTPTDTLVESIALTSPSGHMSKRARDAANKRLNAKLFPPGFWDYRKETPMTEAQKIAQMRRQAQELRDLAQRGMKSRAYAKRAHELECAANERQAALCITDEQQGALKPKE